MDDAGSRWRLIAAITLIMLNAFFVIADTMVARLRARRVQAGTSNGNGKVPSVVHITEHLEEYLTAIQFGTSSVSLALGWVGGPLLANALGTLAAYSSFTTAVASDIAVILGVAIAAVAHAVFGVLIPKALSTQRTDSMSWCVKPLRAAYWLLYPVAWLLRRGINTMLSALRLGSIADAEALAHTEDEIRAIVSSSQEQGILEEHEAVLVENVLDYTDRVAREIMTPRSDTMVVYTHQTTAEAAQFALQQGYTRYPLCRDDKDHVVGLIHIRDILALHYEGKTKTLEELARAALFIPETLPLNEVRQAFQTHGTQLAVVVDEYGSMSGIVTLEDLIEEVFGEFRDEFDEQEPAQVQTTADGLELDAGMLLEEALDVLGIEEEDVEVEGVDTLGGLVFSLLGERPEVGDAVVVDGYVLQVIEVEGLRITRVKACSDDASKLQALDGLAEPGVAVS
ncbi:MAG: hemolysin family protein [Limnochordia bacterium]